MRKKILIGVLGLVGIGVVIVILILGWAHVVIRLTHDPLPSRMRVTFGPIGDQDDLPIRLSVINTASQRMARSSVLDSSKDPQPNEPYVMSHPSFVIEWKDGRILLVDVGMTRQGALDFGRAIERFGGGAPIQPLGSVAEQLGDARQRVRGVVFTHLHTDHVGGITELCQTVGHPIAMFMTDAQAEVSTFTTRPGLQLVHAASCLERQPLKGQAWFGLPGFPGVYLVAAGGHTPGSQLVVAFMQEEDAAYGHVFTGDIVNNIDGINYDIPKPLLYRWLVVPESESRLSELRRYLKDLRDANGFKLLVSHDQLELEQSGVPAWQPH